MLTYVASCDLTAVLVLSTWAQCTVYMLSRYSLPKSTAETPGLILETIVLWIAVHAVHTKFSALIEIWHKIK